VERAGGRGRAAWNLNENEGIDLETTNFKGSGAQVPLTGRQKRITLNFSYFVTHSVNDIFYYIVK